MSSTKSNKPFTIAIIGGGFSGCLTAINIMRRKPNIPLRIVLIERSERIAKGVAYGTTCPLHLLNVPAKDMSALPDVSDHFYNWAKSQDASVNERSFVSRMRFGQYIEWLLNETIENLPAEIHFSRVYDEVKEISVTAGVAYLNFGGETQELCADRVVLALGNLAPANIRLEDQTFYASSNYVRNPWSKNCFAELNKNEPVLLIGTGLTMVDKALELRAAGHTGAIHALSRHGFLPNTHLANSKSLQSFIDESNLPSTALGALVWIRKMVKDAESKDVNWRRVIESIRPVTQKIWKNWNERERKRFIRHLRSHWDVHRHGIAPDIGAAISQMLEDKQLKIHAGRIVAINQVGSNVVVTVRRRSQSRSEQLIVNRVINCTGADSNIGTIDDPLVSYLRNNGYLRSDSLGLGPMVSDNWSLVDKHGQASSVLFAVGPLLKGLLWESIAVPELRTQAVQLANTLLESVNPLNQISAKVPACGIRAF